MQQTWNVTMWLDDQDIEVRYLIHDCNTKFTQPLDAFWSRAGVRCIRISPKAPQAKFLLLNGYDCNAPEDGFAEMVLSVARGEIDKAEVAVFIRRWSKVLYTVQRHRS